MDNQALTQLDTELKHAGEDTTLSPLMLQLEQLRITPDKQLPKMEFLFRVNGKPCFPRKELVAITGKAKSGKTFVSSMLIACCQMRDVLFFHREQEAGSRNEQGLLECYLCRRRQRGTISPFHLVPMFH